MHLYIGHQIRKFELLDSIEVLFQNLDNEQKELIIVGDLNCDLLQRNLSNHTRPFSDIVNLFQLTQLIDHPTRITDKTASLLDVAIVNSPEKISHSGVLHVGISDHSLIYICRKISFSFNNLRCVESRNFKNYVQRDFNYDLHHALLMRNWEINDPNMLWNNFRTTFNYVADIHVPIQSRKVRNMKAPWLKAVKTNSSAYHNAYKSLRNEINKKIIHAKRNYYTTCVDKNPNNSKQLWKHTNQLVNKNPKPTNVSAIQIDEQVVTENDTIAELFNEYFTDIGPKLSSQITETNVGFERYMKFKAHQNLNFRNINLHEVLKALEKLKTSKSTGHDNIPCS